MIRTITAISLLIIAISLCFVSNFMVTSLADDAIKDTETFEKMIKDDKYEELYKKLEKTEKYWIDNEFKLAAFLNHSYLEDVGVIISKLKPLAKEKNKEMFLNQNAELKTKLIHLKEINSLSLRALF